MTSSYKFSCEKLGKILPTDKCTTSSFFDKKHVEWEDVKKHLLPYFEDLHWQPPLKKRLSLELLKENEKVKKAILNYVLY